MCDFECRLPKLVVPLVCRRIQGGNVRSVQRENKNSSTAQVRVEDGSIGVKFVFDHLRLCERFLDCEDQKAIEKRQIILLEQL